MQVLSKQHFFKQHRNQSSTKKRLWKMEYSNPMKDNTHRGKIKSTNTFDKPNESVCFAKRWFPPITYFVEIWLESEIPTWLSVLVISVSCAFKLWSTTFEISLANATTRDTAMQNLWQEVTLMTRKNPDE